MVAVFINQLHINPIALLAVSYNTLTFVEIRKQSNLCKNTLKKEKESVTQTHSQPQLLKPI